MAKIASLKNETCHYEDLAKVNTNLTMELAALREQMKPAKADAMVGLRISQPYYDECGGFYGDGFDDCLKQVATLYPHLDLSYMVIDDTVSPTPRGANVVMNEADSTIHIVEEEVKEPTNADTINQHVLEGQTIPDDPTTL